MPYDDIALTTDRLARTIAYPLGLGGATIRVLECGEGEDAVVLLHGLGSRADRWRRNLPGLAAAGKHVYALDFPGHGAAYLAIVSEVPVRALGLVGTTGIVPIERDTSTTTGRVTELSDAGVRGKLEFLMDDDRLVTDAWVREERRINTSPGAQEALAKAAKYVAESTNDHLVGDRLASSAIPVIVFWGGNDTWIAPAVGRQIKSEVLTKAPLVILRRTGHAPYYERPHVFNDCLVTFLSDPAGYGAEVIEI